MNGEDVIQLDGFSRDLDDLFLSQEDRLVVIEYQDSRIILENAKLEDIDETDLVI